MTKEIEIRGKTIKFTSNGATPLYYKQFFKRDLLKSITVEDEAITIGTEYIPDLAFIMAKQADKADMLHLQMKTYYEWLEMFDPLDLTMKAEEIFDIYISDSMPTEEPKKKDDAELSE